jgi:hypothetical protein
MKLPRLLPNRRDIDLLAILTGAEILAGGLVAIVLLRWVN